MTAMDKRTKPCGWTLVSLRPQGQHGAVADALADPCAFMIALSPWRLQRRLGDPALRQLQQALQASRVIFTSPAAVVAASGALPLQDAPSRPWLAVGEGTLRALRAVGIDHAMAPQRMDSEGLLALPALAAVRGQTVGLVTAPGGRGLIAAHLQERGAQLVRADVYQRVPLRVPPRGLARLSRSPQPWVLAVSSGEALERVWAQLTPDWQARWQARMDVVVASERLRVQVRGLGFAHVVVADGPTPQQMAAACRQLAHRAMADEAMADGAMPDG